MPVMPVTDISSGRTQPDQPGLLLTAAPVAGRGDQVRAPGGVECPGRTALAGLGQALFGVLPDRLEEQV